MRAIREWITRLLGTVRQRRSDRDLERELRMHLELAEEDARRRTGAAGDPGRAAVIAAGGLPQAMDALRDQRGLPWLDALRADVVFGWRQLKKHRAATVAAILSLGLAIGTTTAAFRLVDALLLRPLPLADPGRLFAVATTFIDSDKRVDTRDDFDYPTYRDYLSTAGNSADLMVVGFAARLQVTIQPDGEPEFALRQFLSGNAFATFGLQPELGRLLTTADDVTPGGHAVAVLSYDYWRRRFGGEPGVVGRTLLVGGQPYEIVGVGPKGFTGTEPGAVTDFFIPSVMNVQALTSPGWSWFRLWVRPKPDVTADQVRSMLNARYRATRAASLAAAPPDTPKERLAEYLAEEVRLIPAGSGVSGLQKTFRRPLAIVGVLAVLVLLVACVNVANLLAGQATARAREMALRMSIGAGRRRLIQLVLVESALLAILASVAGAIFAAWAAPLVVSMLAPAERPVRLILAIDWRTLAFGLTLAMSVALLFGLAPALRASSIDPLGTLKGGNPHAPRRLGNVLIGAQMAFCMFLLVAGGLFVVTLQRLLDQPLGFSDRNLLVVQAEMRTTQPPAVWTQVASGLREYPGVQSAAVAGWVPLSGNRWRSAVRTEGDGFGPNSPHFVSVSPGYFETMAIGMVQGRDFMPEDAAPGTDDRKQPVAGVGIVNEAFAKAYFKGRETVGQRVYVRQTRDVEAPMEIVGVVRDAVYYNVRETMSPAVYVPIEPRNGATLIVRTASDPVALAPLVRRELSRARPDLRVRAVEQQSGLVRQQTIRERLLATLSVFFSAVALLLAGIGLYGVLTAGVVRQGREIGIRVALGASATHIVKRVTSRLTLIVCLGSVAGLAAGVAFGRFVQTLLFQVTPTDVVSLAVPVAILGIVAVVAALPAAIRAVRIDPARILRTE